MESIYKYENYRQYLQDYFDERKNIQKSFSSRYFARKCGFSSHSYCRMVINGERNLSDESIKRISQGLGLKSKESQYFKFLVYYQQSENIEKKEYFFKHLIKLKRSTKHYCLNQNHIKYFKNWYFPVIRHLAVYAKWDNDYTKLAGLVYPKISAGQAKQAVETLVAIGLLEQEDDGKYSMNAKVITSKDIPTFLKKKARKEMLGKGTESAEISSSNIRHTTYTTISISENTYELITNSMNKLRRDIIEQSVNETNASRVYELIFQLFPVSEIFINNTSKNTQ